MYARNISVIYFVFQFRKPNGSLLKKITVEKKKKKTEKTLVLMDRVNDTEECCPVPSRPDSDLKNEGLNGQSRCYCRGHAGTSSSRVPYRRVSNRTCRAQCPRVYECALGQRGRLLFRGPKNRTADRAWPRHSQSDSATSVRRSHVKTSAEKVKKKYRSRLIGGALEFLCPSPVHVPDEIKKYLMGIV